MQEVYGRSLEEVSGQAEVRSPPLCCFLSARADHNVSECDNKQEEYDTARAEYDAAN